MNIFKSVYFSYFPEKLCQIFDYIAQLSKLQKLNFRIVTHPVKVNIFALRRSCSSKKLVPPGRRCCKRQNFHPLMCLFVMCHVAPLHYRVKLSIQRLQHRSLSLARVFNWVLHKTLTWLLTPPPPSPTLRWTLMSKVRKKEGSFLSVISFRKG